MANGVSCMPSSAAIVVDNVSKKYSRSIKRSMLYGLSDIGRNMLGLRTDSGRLRSGEFWAAENISFEVQKGESLGVIGTNGSGKTTLLKMLNGIFWPDKGKITVRGRVGALIAVGAGFHPLLTGRENIHVNGAILGMNKKEIDSKFDSIVDFADIESFLDSPVKHYSSGMFVRLGFAVAIHCNPDILLVDEVLAVGDIQFQAKCIKKMNELKQQGVTKIFVSHSLNAVQRLCDRVLHLEKGQVKNYGTTTDVLDLYKREALLAEERVGDATEARYGTKEVTIKKVEFLDREGRPQTIFKRGGFLQVRISYTAKKKVEEPEFSVGFDRDDVTLIKATTKEHSFSTGTIEGDGEVLYTIEEVPLKLGRYAVTIGCWNSTGHFAYDHHENLYEVLVEDGAIRGKIRERYGMVHIPATWDIRQKT